MTVNATEFKARCLEIIDKVHRTGEPVIITKRGKVVAKLVAESGADRPWLALRGTGSVWKGDPFAPVVKEEDIEVLK